MSRDENNRARGADCMIITCRTKCTQIRGGEGWNKWRAVSVWVSQFADTSVKYPTTSPFAEKAAKAGQFWGCPDESVRNNACHHGYVNRRVRLGGNVDTQDIELWWHLHRSAFQKTARSPRQNSDTRINIHIDCRHTEWERQLSWGGKKGSGMSYRARETAKGEADKGIRRRLFRDEHVNINGKL